MKRITTLLAAIISMAFMNQASATHAIVEVTTAGQLNSIYVQHWRKLFYPKG